MSSIFKPTQQSNLARFLSNVFLSRSYMSRARILKNRPWNRVTRRDPNRTGLIDRRSRRREDQRDHIRDEFIRNEFPYYFSHIETLVRSRDFEGVQACLDEIMDFNIPCHEILFVDLIHRYCEFGFVDKAVEIFHKMPSFDCYRTVLSLNSLLDELFRADRFSEANELFRCSSRMRIRLDLVTFNIVIRGRLGEGDLEGAWKVFDEMPKREVEPNVVTYNYFIGYFCRKGDLGEAKRLIAEMIVKEVLPDAKTYGFLMKGLCLSGKYKDAKKVMFDMEYRSCRPTIANFEVLMADLGRRGEIDEAKMLLDEIKEKGLKPNGFIFNVLEKLICKKSKGLEAYKILMDMEVNGFKPSLVMYKTVLNGLCWVEDFERGLKVLGPMLASGFVPRQRLFMSLVTGLLKSGDLEGSGFVLEEMRNRAIGLDLASWEGLVMEACGRNVGENLLTELIE